MDYKILIENCPDTLSESVKAHLNNAWKLVGGVAVMYKQTVTQTKPPEPRYYQAISRKNDADLPATGLPCCMKNCRELSVTPMHKLQLCKNHYLQEK